MIAALFSKFSGLGSRGAEDQKGDEENREISESASSAPAQGRSESDEVSALTVEEPRNEISPQGDLDEEDEEELEADVVDGNAELEEQDFSHIHDDPLAPAYDLDRGEPISRRGHDRAAPGNWKSKIQSASEFLQTEILYRFDILERPDREKVKGSYRLDLKGYKGGIWTIILDNELTVLNRREEADAVLSMQHQDFVRIVNGELNPQLGILSQKVRATGDMRRIVAFMALLAPEGQ